MFKKSQTLFLLPLFFLVLFFVELSFGAKSSCRDYCQNTGRLVAGACYTPEWAESPAATCKCGIQYCHGSGSKGACERNAGYSYNPNAANPAERCTKTKTADAQSARPQDKTCADPMVLGNVYDDSSGGEGGSVKDCVCKYTNQPLAAGEKCEEKKPEQAGKPQGSPQTNIAEAQCNSAGGKFVVDDPDAQVHTYGCLCSSTSSIIDPTKGDRCNAAAAAVVESADAIFARVKQQCGLTEAEAKIAACGEKSFTAVEACEEKADKEGSSNREMKGVLDVLGQVQMNNGIENANPDVCGKAAYGATTAYWAIDAFKTTCDKEIKECTAACNPLKEKQTFKAMAAECEKLYNEAFKVAGTSSEAPSGLTRQNILQKNKKNENRSEDYQVVQGIREYITEMERDTQRSLAKCETDAVNGQMGLSDYLGQMLNSSMAAAQCKSAATNSAARCAAMATQLSPAFCLNKPTEPCCCPFNGTCNGAVLTDCNGKDYATKQCVCARTPDAATCKIVTNGGGTQVANVGGVSGLAAPGGITSGAGYKPTGVVPSGGVDVPLDDASKMQGAGGTGGSQNPFGVAGGGGGGGGGGLPNSPNDGMPPGGPGAGDGTTAATSGGPFNQLKTWADRIMGGGTGGNGSKNYGADGKGKDPKKAGAGVDPNKWRPGLRGVAGGSEFGPRNKDIWKTMNVQYGIQNHTFLGIDGK